MQIEEDAKSTGAKASAPSKSPTNGALSALSARVTERPHATPNETHKEKPLDSFLPKAYSAILEGTLLTNGDLKGSWRKRREDRVNNQFCMVLMDRGVYDGGFNVCVPRDDPSKPAVREIHDKWNSFEWCETTKGSSNVWGRGRNIQFGECYLIGVHDPNQGRIIMYKVDEAEILRAQAFARTTTAVATPLSTSPCPVHYPGVPSATVGQKRPRTFPSKGDISVAASQFRQSYGGGGARGIICEKNRTDNPTTVDVGAPPVPHQHASQGNKGGTPGFSSLPGFSGLFEDTSRCDTASSPASVDELADLTILGARLQREKRRIQHEARNRRQPFLDLKADCERKLKQAKADEAMMLRAVQELRQQMVLDERELADVAQRVKRCETEERRALILWNEKWETQVAPFIAQCEQGVKKKAQDLEKKTREAEKERYELERELERLHSVKKIGNISPPDAPIR